MPRLMASVGDAIADRLAIQQNFTFIRMIHAIQDLHQRAFARAIFTQQGMDFTGLHVKINVVTGKHAGESLGDAAHFQAVDTGPARGEFIGFGHGAILKVLGAVETSRRHCCLREDFSNHLYTTTAE